MLHLTAARDFVQSKCCQLDLTCRMHPRRATDPSVGYRANLWLRSAVRVLQLVGEDYLNPDASGATELYRATREAADWAALLRPGQSFSVDARIGSCTGKASC